MFPTLTECYTSNPSHVIYRDFKDTTHLRPTKNMVTTTATVIIDKGPIIFMTMDMRIVEGLHLAARNA